MAFHLSPHNNVDDILVHSTDKQQYLIHLQEVFDRLKQAGLKVSAVQEWPTPDNASD